MQADQRDRIGATRPGDRDNGQKQGPSALVIVVVALILGAGAWLLLPGDDEEAAPQPVAPAEVMPAQPPRPDPAANIAAAPDIPEPEPEPEPAMEPEAPVEEAPPPEPPTQEEIDASLREALVGAGASNQPALATALAAPFLLDRGVSAIDQIARGYVPERALNMPRPSGQFVVRRDGQTRYIDEQSYERYNSLVDGVTAVTPETLAARFDDFRPLLSSAYAALGYPADAVDNATIAALDAILAAPVLRDPVVVKSKGALWAYADPELESRSDLHKQLMRMGPDNLEELQRWAQDLRNALLQ